MYSTYEPDSSINEEDRRGDVVNNALGGTTYNADASLYKIIQGGVSYTNDGETWAVLTDVGLGVKSKTVSAGVSYASPATNEQLANLGIRYNEKTNKYEPLKSNTNNTATNNQQKLQSIQSGNHSGFISSLTNYNSNSSHNIVDREQSNNDMDKSRMMSILLGE